ncbi:MAG: hypothetical protein WCF95_05670 [bacterium]
MQKITKRLYLQKPFYEWFSRKMTEYFKENEYYFDFENNKFDMDNFIKTFVEPYEKISTESFNQIAEMQTALVSHKLNKKFIFKIIPIKQQDACNALVWTLLQVDYLKFFDIQDKGELTKSEHDELLGYYDERNKQCLFCSRPDKDEHGNIFDGRTKFCFFENRKNPKIKTTIEEYSEDCCSGKWRLLYSNLINNISRIENESQLKHKKLSEEEKIQRIIEVFIDFCEELLEHNLYNKYTVQTEESSAKVIEAFK